MEMTKEKGKKSYDLRMPNERQYIASERAHLMCPNMHFDMLFKVNSEYDETKLREVLENASKAHPFLRSVISCEEGTDKLYYDVSSMSRITITICNKAFDINEYELLMKNTWNVFEEGLLRVYVYNTSNDFEVLFMAHHLLCDGSGLIMLVREIADNYVNGKEIPYVEEKLISDISDLPDGSNLKGVSKFLVNRANKQWKKENHKVSYSDYHSFEKNFNIKHTLLYQTYDVSDDTYNEMKNLCKANGFTMNDLLMAKMYIKTGFKKIIIAADIRDKFKFFKDGSLGNFATAMGIVCKSKITDEVEKAKEVHGIVRKVLSNNSRLMTVLACYFSMDPTLLDAAAISGLGGFDSKAAQFVGGGMFGFSKPSSYSITNLGRINCESLRSAMFIPPASPAAKLTLGVITVNDKMYACSSKCT